MESVNWLGSLVGGVLAFVIGGVWYAFPVFGSAWMEGIGKSAEELAASSSPLRTYGGALVLSVASAVVFSLFLGPDPAPGMAAGAGFAAGLVWVGGSLGISYLFEARPLRLWLINAGYHTVQFTVIGVALALID